MAGCDGGLCSGAHKLQLEIAKRKENIAVVGIPKTIDNDIGLIDRSFGFNTAVEEACKAVASAKVRRTCCLHSNPTEILSAPGWAVSDSSQGGAMPDVMGGNE
eukprot:COSAG01_NODE_2419_length_7731_cov_34.853138_6_plen_103_part_00